MRIVFVGSTIICSILLGTVILGILSGGIVFGAEEQNATSVSVSATDEIIELLAKELILAVVGAFGIAISAFMQWMRTKGIPVTTEQEAMFKEILTKRFEMLAKRGWGTMREDIKNNPQALNEYWSELKTGHIPQKFQKILREEGKTFADNLRQNKEFRGFAQKIQGEALDKLLANVRTELKNEYQKRMIDVIPRLASIAVDSAFDKNVNDVDTWAKKSLENMKPLLFSTESIDTEDNLMIIIKSEINKRFQKR